MDLRNKTHWIKMTNICATASIADIRTMINQKMRTKRRIKSVYLYPHAQSEQFTQFAFIECEDTAIASLVVQSLRGQELKGMRVWTTWSGHKVDVSPRLELKGKTKHLV